MKIRNHKDAFVIGGLLAGTVMVLGGIINCLHSYDFKHCSLIWVGLIMLGSALYAMRRPETEVLPDERTEKNDQRAGYAAFWIIVMSGGLLLLADERGLYNLEIRGTLSATLLIGVFSFVILGWYYNRVEGK
ncbi:MAG: hypothetical protein J7J06_10025 [Methanosarcinales archaeon]|nr:hypothetical protein [Methanosarcinales archaeon]